MRITDEAVFVIEGSGQQLTQQQYLDYSRDKVRQVSQAQKLDDLRNTWINAATRRILLTDFHAASVYVDVLADVLGQSEADQFNLLGHLTFGTPLRSRSKRAAAFINRRIAVSSGATQTSPRSAVSAVGKVPCN